MTAFSAVRPSAIKLKSAVRFPARVIGGIAISVDKAHGTYTIDLDYSELNEVATFDPQFVEVAIWNPHTDEWARIALDDFVNGSFGASVAGYHLQTNGVGTAATWEGFLQAGTGAVIRTWRDKAREFVTLEDFGAVGDGVTDDSAAFVAALTASSRVVGRSGGIYAIKNVVLNGKEFDGRGCAIRDLSGANFCFKLTGFQPKLRNVVIQDQRNMVRQTTLSANVLAGATTISVTSTTGLAAGQIVFVLGNTEIWAQTLISSVGVGAITLRDAMPETASSGSIVTAMQSAVLLEDADWYVVENIMVVNSTSALVMKPSNSLPTASSTTVGKGSISKIRVVGCEFLGFGKYGSSHDAFVSDVQIWGGLTDHFTYTGAGVAGSFSFAWKVYLLRDVTVYVNSVSQVYGTDWEFASDTAVRFKAGHFPAVGTTIDIYHSRNGVRGWVEDQRGTPFIPGGSKFVQINVLGMLVGYELQSVTLSDYAEIVADTCKLQAISTSNCDSTTRFGKTFCGFSAKSIVSFGDINGGVQYDQLFTSRVPSSANYAEAIGLAARQNNITCDTGAIGINTPGWTGGDYQFAGSGAFNWKGAKAYTLASSSNVAAASTVYFGVLGPQSTQIAPVMFEADTTILETRCEVDNVPGAGQTFTYTLQINEVDQASSVATISGAASFAASSTPNVNASKYNRALVKLVTSAGASARQHRILLVAK